MKAKDLRWFVAAYCAVLILALTVRSDEMIGVTVRWSNGGYSYQAGSAPWALACAVVGAVLYILLLASRAVATMRRTPYLFRRWAAGIVDFMWAFVVPIGLIGFAAVLSEYRRTGIFDWFIERQQRQPGDILFGVSVFVVMFVIMPGYFTLSWWRGKPTPGSCIFGFRIVADEGTRLNVWKACLRALLGSMALLGWPCWILAYCLKRDKSAGKFWLDAIFHTHAEYFE